LDSPEPTTTEPFAPGALYEIKIDTNGDAIADICYSVQFASSEDGKQAATVRRIQGARASGVGEDGEVIVEQAPVSVAREALVTKAAGCCFFFGWRSDPFFFDVNGNFNQMQFTGDDFFTDKDVCSIVLELPNSALGTNAVGIWARTVDKTADGWIQADRGGRPLQAVFLPARRERNTSAETPQMIIASSACSLTNWNTRAATRRRTPKASRERCCQTFSPMILAARFPFRTMAGR